MRTTEMSMDKMIKGLQMVRSNHEDEVMVSLEHGEIGVFDLVHNVILALGKIKALSPVEPDGKDINVTTTDAISRQAAMDICDTFNGQGSVWAVIKGYIKALPPLTIAESETVEDCVSRQAAIDAMQKLIIADDEEGLMLLENNQAVNNCIVTVMGLSPVEQKQGKWILVHGEPPKNSLSTTKIFAECSCCGEPLKSHGKEIGWGYYPEDGRTIIWSGFITNYSSNPEAAKAFAMKAAESVPEDAYPKYCENCGAKMQGGDTDVNDK